MRNAYTILQYFVFSIILQLHYTTNYNHSHALESDSFVQTKFVETSNFQLTILHVLYCTMKKCRLLIRLNLFKLPQQLLIVPFKWLRGNRMMSWKNKTRCRRPKRPRNERLKFRNIKKQQNSMDRDLAEFSTTFPFPFLFFRTFNCNWD